MTDKHKTPEELAEEVAATFKLSDLVELGADDDDGAPASIICDQPEYEKQLKVIWLAGYNAAKHPEPLNLFKLSSDSYLAGYEAARPKWISVKERLPEMYKEVLCVLSDGYEMVASRVPDDTWTDPEGREYEQKRFVIVFTHWQPLPEPPKDL